MNPSGDAAARALESLRGLRRTLEAERAALIANDADAILSLSQTKLGDLQRLEHSHDAQVFAGFTQDLRDLAELNIANGALIARRRQETIWTLRQLGMYEGESAYDMRGGYGGALKSRRAVRA